MSVCAAQLASYFESVEERLQREDDEGLGTEADGGSYGGASYARAVANLPSWDEDFGIGVPRGSGSTFLTAGDGLDGADEGMAAARLQGVARGRAARRRQRQSGGATSSRQLDDQPPHVTTVLRVPVPPTLSPYAPKAPRRRSISSESPPRPPPPPPPDVEKDTVGHGLWELRKAMASRMQRVMDVFQKLDVNGDQRVTRNEFRRAFPLLELPTHYGVERMDELFDAMDRDRSGFIDLAELRSALRRDLADASGQAEPAAASPKERTSDALPHPALPAAFSMPKPPGRRHQPPGRRVPAPVGTAAHAAARSAALRQDGI